MTQNVRWYARRGDMKRLFDADQTVESTWTFASPLYLSEIAAAEEDRAGYGQIWVKSDTPNTLWFTDDAGTDFQIGGAGGGDDEFTSIFISEQATDQADRATFSQVWVSNAASPGISGLFSSLWFTDHAGNAVPIVADAWPVLLTEWTFIGAYTAFTGQVSLEGDDAYLSFQERPDAPVVALNSGALYVKDVGGTSTLFFKPGGGAEVQIT